VAPGFLAVAVLVAMRLVPAALLLPVLGGPMAPWSARLALTTMAALALAAVQPPEAAAAAGALPAAGLIAIGVKELAIGAVLALVVAVPFLAADAAGRWIGVAIGAPGGGNVVGPAGATSPTGALATLLAILVFIGIDGHLIVVDALARSYEALPLFGGIDRDAAAREVLGAATGFLAAAVALAAPALVAGALVELALGLATRGGGMQAGLGALRGAAVVAFVAASLMVLAGMLARGTGDAARALDGVVRALGG
jgi:flagellar biosynthesis protein FliR